MFCTSFSNNFFKYTSYLYQFDTNSVVKGFPYGFSGDNNNYKNNICFERTPQATYINFRTENNYDDYKTFNVPELRRKLTKKKKKKKLLKSKYYFFLNINFINNFIIIIAYEFSPIKVESYNILTVSPTKFLLTINISSSVGINAVQFLSTVSKSSYEFLISGDKYNGTYQAVIDVYNTPSFRDENGNWLRLYDGSIVSSDPIVYFKLPSIPSMYKILKNL
nr:unknown [Dictyostelium discoideum]